MIRVIAAIVLSLSVSGCGTMFRGSYQEPTSNTATISFVGTGDPRATLFFISESNKECKDMKRAGYASPAVKVNTDVKNKTLKGVLEFAAALQDREEVILVKEISANRPIQIQGYVNNKSSVAGGTLTYTCGPVTHIFNPVQGAKYRAEFFNGKTCSMKIFNSEDNSLVPISAARCMILDM